MVKDGELKIGWVISHDREWAASRLQGYLVHEWLLRQGADSTIVLEQFNRVPSPRSWAFVKSAVHLLRSKCDVVVFEGGNWPMMQLAKLWRASGRRAVGTRCDPIPGAYDRAYDLTVVPTAELQQRLAIERARVIDDSAEIPPGKFKTDYSGASRLKVVWMGHQGYADYIVGLVARLQQHPEIAAHFDFELVSKGEFATKQWSEATVADDILACDIALLAIPAGTWFQTKSANRLALMMGLGMPVVASLIPSYRSLAQPGVNGLFIESDEAIADALLALRDPAVRAELGRQARLSVADRYSIEAIGPRWLAALREAWAGGPQAQSAAAPWRWLVRLLQAGSR